MDGSHPASSSVTTAPAVAMRSRPLARLWSFLGQDGQLKALLILGIIAADLLLITAKGLVVPLRDMLAPLLMTGLLVGVGYFYHRIRPVPQFVLCAVTLVQMVLFPAAFMVLMYSLAAGEASLADELLMRVDQWFGVAIPEVVTWVRAHPVVNIPLAFSYDTLIPQTALVIIILGLRGDRRPLETFLLRFMLGALLTAVVFIWLPAAGPFHAYGFAPSAAQARYLAHLEGLREGTRFVVTWNGAEGLITFPSFHTTWALLLALAVRHRRVLFTCSLVLNVAVVISTLTTGWHYFADVLGGLVVTAVVVLITTALSGWLYPTRAVPAAAGAARPAVTPVRG
ncbi:MAG TPA: phosphatase PAP2 family protein [Phycisphaerae bacterium]|nr:phosphatase PAP2 family protein [Phycisphaerae bacterium]HNU43766.1 phosphatase PAP2 family protein [Phycisphaerae bacterium]